MIEEATFLTKYASVVYVLVRRDKLRASKVMADRLISNPKIKVLWNKMPLEAVGYPLFNSRDSSDSIVTVD